MAARIDDGDDDGSELHEINVTPFIDVMLVLLIIFMVAAPLSTVDVAVDLPVSTAKPQPRPDKPLFLTIKADLSLAIGNEPIPRGQLAQAIDAATETDRQKRIFLRADKTVPYGELMIVMNLLRAGGYLKLALVGLEGQTPGHCPLPARPLFPLPLHLPALRRHAHDLAQRPLRAPSSPCLALGGSGGVRPGGAHRLHGAGAHALAGGHLRRRRRGTRNRRDGAGTGRLAS